MNYTLDIDTFLGAWYFSKQNAKAVLAKNKDKEVTVRVNSLGGDLDHGLDIATQFEEHGNVTVNYVSFNASSATVIGLGAKKVRMHADAQYLIHKVMSWVDTWGYMNEDKIQEAIDKLEKEKKENEKITLQLARKYANKTGKSTIDILKLMKEETWLNATEAKEWGFVDEIYGTAEGKVNFASMEGKFNALGLPMPERKNNQEDNKEPNLAERLMQKLDEKLEAFKNQFSPKEDKDKTNDKNPKIVMKKDWTHINALLGVEGIESTEGKVNLTEEQLQKLNEKLANAENDLKLANEGKTKAEDDLAEKVTEFENYKNAAGDKSNPSNPPVDGGKENKSDSFFNALGSAREMYDSL